MELQAIKSLLEDFSRLNICTMELDTENFRIRLAKSEISDKAKPAAADERNVCITPAEEQKTLGGEIYTVKSPLVGVYYPAPAPDAEPFVTVGKIVKTGDTLCILEAMKTMNKVNSPVNGKVKAVLAKKEELLGYDSPIIEIEVE